MTKYMFYECSSLVSVTSPNSAQKIEYAAFGRCFGLVNVEFPSSLLTLESPFIGSYYQGFDNLKSIKLKTMVPPVVEGGFFEYTHDYDNVYNNVILYVPKGSKKTYVNANWGNLCPNIVEY